MPRTKQTFRKSNSNKTSGPSNITNGTGTTNEQTPNINSRPRGVSPETGSKRKAARKQVLNVQKEKKRRFRPGTVALREIVKM
jgi:hypothetical protein